jgi:DNA-binding helix-hairpin-helix protein with protein kinase domain
MHKYLGTLRKCPWCEAEQSRNFIAFLARTARAAEAAIGAGFDIDRVWARIAAVQSPGDAPIPAFRSQAAPSAVPGWVGAGQQWAIIKRVLGLALVMIGFVIPALVWLAIPGFILLMSRANTRGERARRYDALQQAQYDWEAAANEWQEEATDARFMATYHDLAKARDDLKQLEQSRKAEIERLKQTLHARQLEKYLDRFYVRDSGVTGMSPMLAAGLASFGIETAADVRMQAIPLLFTVGPLTANELVEWAQAIEHRFRFDPRQGVDPNDIALIDHRFRAMRQDLERKLQGGADTLERERQAALAKRSSLLPRLEAAAKAYAQARADYGVI